MAIIESAIALVVGLLIGALGIYVGARVIVDYEDYTYAIVTALIATLVWILLGWIPLLGPILALVAYIAIINWRYPGGWLQAIGIALIAWIASFVVLYVLAVVGITSFSAIGVPGA